MKKRISRKIKLGKTIIGGNTQPVIQTMITTPLIRIDEAIKESLRAYSLGCNVVRTAFKEISELDNLKKLAKTFPGEIVADIHFDYRLAIAAVESGVTGVRINPGNIGSKERVAEVIKALSDKENVALRIGVNSGSMEKELQNMPLHEAMIESVKKWTYFIEDKLGYKNFKISVKASDINETIKACNSIAKFTDAPFHAGITEAGGGIEGIIKSSAGLGILMNSGFADTFRVSLSDKIEKEVNTGFAILKSMGLLETGIDIVSCPTCGRTKGPVIAYRKKLSEILDNSEKSRWLRKPLKVAIMGCEVNGPGEASDANIGIAFGKGCAIMFENGKQTEKFSSQEEAFNVLIRKIEELS